MTTLRFAGACGALLSLACLAPAASAAVRDVTSVGIDSWNSLNVAGRNEVATAIALTTTELPKPLWVFCVDLAHNISVQGYAPPLQYQTGLVTTDSSGATSGTGAALSLAQSEEIQTLANLGSGLANASTRNSDKLTAIAGAIWEVEYNLKPSQVVGTDAQNALIAYDIAYAQQHAAANYSKAVYAVGGASQGFATPVPEPAAWAMMIVGLGLVGVALRRRRFGGRRPAVA